jgi:hypothetical protein
VCRPCSSHETSNICVKFCSGKPGVNTLLHGSSLQLAVSSEVDNTAISQFVSHNVNTHLQNLKRIILYFLHNTAGTADGGTVVKVLRYKSEGRWFDSKWCHWDFSLTESFRSHYGPGVDSASNRNE